MPVEAVTAFRQPAARLPWWMAGLAAAFAGYYALLVHSDLTRPEPAGFVFDIHDGRMILGAVAPESPAARAGLAAGDHVRQVNRQHLWGLEPRDMFKVEAEDTKDVEAAFGQP